MLHLLRVREDHHKTINDLHIATPVHPALSPPPLQFSPDVLHENPADATLWPTDAITTVSCRPPTAGDHGADLLRGLSPFTFHLAPPAARDRGTGLLPWLRARTAGGGSCQPGFQASQALEPRGAPASAARSIPACPSTRAGAGRGPALVFRSAASVLCD